MFHRKTLFLIGCILLTGCDRTSAPSLSPLHTFPIGEGEVLTATLSLNGNRLAYVFGRVALMTTEGEGTLRIVEYPTGQAVADFKTSDNYVPRLIQLTPDGAYLAAAKADGLRIWNVKDSRVEKEITQQEQNTLNPARPIFVTRMAFSPDGRWLALAGTLETFLYEWKKDAPPIKIPVTEPRSMVFAADSKQLILGHVDNTKHTHFIYVYNVDSGQLTIQIPTKTDPIYVGMSKDLKQIAAFMDQEIKGGAGNTNAAGPQHLLKLSVPEGQEMAKYDFPDNNFQVKSAAFSIDMSMAAASNGQEPYGADFQITYLFDMATGKKQKMPGYKVVAIDPAGNLVVEDRGTVCVYAAKK